VDWTSQRCQFSGTVTSNNGAIGRFIASSAQTFTHIGQDLTIFQSTVSEKTTIVAASQSKAWVAYSTFRYMEMTGACEIVGNHFNMRGSEYSNIEEVCLQIKNSGGIQNIHNNIIYGASNITNVSGYNYENYYERYEITVTVHSYPAVLLSYGTGTTTFINNVIYNFYHGIYVDDSALALVIEGNYHERANLKDLPGFTWEQKSYYPNPKISNFLGNSRWNGIGKIIYRIAGGYSNPSFGSIYCKHQNALIRNNIFSPQFDNNSPVFGGIATENTTLTLPFLNTATPSSTNFFRFPADSAAIDAGPDMAIYTDLDGSRNDVGAYGGHSYDPTGRTTTKPVVLSGSVDPLYVKRGGSVTIEARAAVVAEP
jgi:hypothetical protein